MLQGFIVVVFTVSMVSNYAIKLIVDMHWCDGDVKVPINVEDNKMIILVI